MTDQIKATPEPARLLVRPREARTMLGDPSPEFFWARILPELRSFLHGKARWIEVASIHDYIRRHLAEPTKRFVVPNPKGEPARRSRAMSVRKRGRSRKIPAQSQVTASTG